MNWRQRLPEKELTYAVLLKWAERELQYAQVPDPQTDARLLLFHVFDLDMTAFLLRSREAVPGAEGATSEDPLIENSGEEKGLEHFLVLLARRCERVPLQHILGTAPFMGLEMLVGPDVLVPRPDTEVLAERALEILRTRAQAGEPGEGSRAPRVLDLCTGSGCLAVALKSGWPQIECFAADLSGRALRTARENAARNGTRITFLQGDLFDALHSLDQKESRFDLIVSNPPYIPTGDIASLAPEVKDYDPLLALDGGQDGLAFYRRIAEAAPRYLRPGGYLCLETGYDQGEAVRALLEAAGFHAIRICRDLAGLDRVVEAVWDGSAGD